MQENPCQYLSYLFAGFTAIWIVLFAYLYHLRQREKGLLQEIELLQSQVAEERRTTSP